MCVLRFRLLGKHGMTLRKALPSCRFCNLGTPIPTYKYHTSPHHKRNPHSFVTHYAPSNPQRWHSVPVAIVQPLLLPPTPSTRRHPTPHLMSLLTSPAGQMPPRVSSTNLFYFLNRPRLSNFIRAPSMHLHHHLDSHIRTCHVRLVFATISRLRLTNPRTRIDYAPPSQTWCIQSRPSQYHEISPRSLYNIYLALDPYLHASLSPSTISNLDWQAGSAETGLIMRMVLSSGSNSLMHLLGLTTGHTQRWWWKRVIHNHISSSELLRTTICLSGHSRARCAWGEMEVQERGLNW